MGPNLSIYRNSHAHAHAHDFTLHVLLSELSNN